MADQSSSKSDGNWVQILVALISAASVITVGYWQYFGKDSSTKFAGRIVDSITEENISGAKITFETEGTPSVMYTDSEGIFSFTLQQSEDFARVRVEADGYTKFNRLLSPLSSKGLEEIKLEPIQNESDPPKQSAVGRVSPMEVPETQIIESPIDFIYRYYSTINEHYVERAWGMLTPHFQQRSSSNYNEYYNWWTKVDEVQVKDVYLIKKDEDSALVDVYVSYVIEEQIHEEKPLRFTLVWNSEIESWQIDDRLKL